MPQTICPICKDLVTVDAVPPNFRCEKCVFAAWQHLQPLKGYRLSENDRKFLKGIRISQEV